MKKYLFLISVAAVAMTACTSETEEFVGSEQAREISFSPITQKHTRAAVLDGTFPTSNTMEVAAYQSAPTPASNYFTKTTFSNVSSTTNWSGGKYWPIGEATLNFFAVSGSVVNASDITIANDLSTASVSYKTTGNPSSTAYSNTTQSDIMYAFGRGSVTKSGNSFRYNSGNPVAMQFKHALSLISFTVRAKDAASTAITINSIKLKDACYTGTLTLNNDAAVTASSGTVTTTVGWAADAAVSEVTVPNVPSSLKTTAAPAAGNACLMIIPKASAFTSFVINYSLNGVAYDYEYTPSSAVTAVAGTNYTYNIEFGSNEILIAPTVSTWAAGGGTITVQ